MAGLITAEFKERLLARIDIVDLVSARVELKKVGTQFKARCPFHTEKTPSFFVTPERQTYHCFGCGVHGNAIDFLIEYDRLDFREAIEELAHQAGIPLPESNQSPDQGPDLKPLYAMLERAALLFQQQLREHPDAARALDYLKRRGLSGEIAQRFSIGYAPPGWDFLLRSLGGSSTNNNNCWMSVCSPSVMAAAMTASAIVFYFQFTTAAAASSDSAVACLVTLSQST